MVVLSAAGLPILDLDLRSHLFIKRRRARLRGRCFREDEVVPTAKRSEKGPFLVKGSASKKTGGPGD